MTELLTPEEIKEIMVANCKMGNYVSLGDVIACCEAVAKAAVAKVKMLYPIMYQEEADEVGDFIRRGWIPPEEAQLAKSQEAQDDCPECNGEGRTALLGRCWNCNGTGKVQKARPDPDREKIIDIFGCSRCVALQECLTDEPMNFCKEKRDHLKQILALIKGKREQERERIIYATEEYLINTYPKSKFDDLVGLQEMWQALEGADKEEK